MQIKVKNTFFIKVFLIFWLFCAALLVTLLFISGQFPSLSWISPRERIFINAHASVLTIALTKSNNAKNVICELNKNLANSLYLVSSTNKIIHCDTLPHDIMTIHKHKTPHAFVYGQYLVSDIIHKPHSKETYRLAAIKKHELYPVLLKQSVLPRLMIAASMSGLLCYLLALYLTYPLKIVVTQMSRFAKGNLKVRVGDLIRKRKDEFTEIGREFDNMANNIEDLIQAKQQMLYNVSHELRSPLARQLISLDLLKQLPKEEHPELITHVEEENAHINDLIANILTLAKLSTKTFPFHPKKTNVANIILKAIDNINFENQTACIVYKGEKEPFMVVDKKLLRIAIENILKNAITYAGKTKPILVEEKVINDQLIISVHDKGPGMDETCLANVFEPFFQSKNKRKVPSKDNGYGLGLSITKEIISLHSGCITAKNRVDGGLSILLTLPKL